MENIIRSLQFVKLNGLTVHVRAIGTALEFDALSQALEAAVNAGVIQSARFDEQPDESRPLRTVGYMAEWLTEEEQEQQQEEAA